MELDREAAGGEPGRPSPVPAPKKLSPWGDYLYTLGTVLLCTRKDTSQKGDEEMIETIKVTEN